MKDLFHLPVHFSRQFIALCLALLTLFATPASGQFLSDGVTPVNPIPNSNAILLAHIGNCLAEQPVTGLCTTWGDNSGFGAIPSWDVTNVNDFGNAFLNRTTFNGDLSRWNMINATSLYRMFQNARAFNRDISGWTVSNVRNFDGTFYIALAFNQDISGWDTSAATDMKNMFQQANAFNQDIRKWTVTAAANRTKMFLNAPAMTAVYGTHPLYGDTPRREFFYADNVATLEELAFPNNGLATINFQRNTLNYNVTIFDEKGIEIRVRPTEFDNVGHANASVSIGGSGPLVLDAQGYATHTVPVTMTRANPAQTVSIDVTSPDGTTVLTYTLNLSTQVIDDTNIASFVVDCLAEDPVGGICPNWASGAGLPTMPNWDVSDVTQMNAVFARAATFNGDISKWDTSNVTSMLGTFQQSANFNQDISDWDVSNVTQFSSMFSDATAFNQDIRKWAVTAGADLRGMFPRANAMHARFAGTTYFADTPRAPFFYAYDTDTLENLSFPNDPSVAISFNRQTRVYNLTVPDNPSIDISLGVSDFSNVGAFNFVSYRDGNFSGYFNGRSSLEVQLAHDMVLGYFLGVEVGRARLSGTFSGRQDSYGLNAGGYVLRSFNDVSYITGFAALGRNKNQLVVSNGTLQVDSDFDSTTLRLGASATGVFKTARIEIWPELSFSYAKSRVGSQAVAAQAYGLTANNLNLAGGDVEMGQLMFMPQIKWPLGDGRDSAAVANFSLSPRLTCRVTRGAGGGRACGTGAALGYSAASGDGLTLFNATVEFDNVADTKNGSLTFNVEHNF